MRKRDVFVVPMESSPDMRHTIATAVALAEGRGATVHLIEVDPPHKLSYADMAARDAGAGIPAARARESVSIRSRKSGVRTVRHPGKPLDVIPAYAQLEDAALIVVGSNHGTPGWRRGTGFVGTLSRAAPVPVLVLPNGFRCKRRPLSFTRVVSAVDFTVASAVAVRAVLDIVPRSGAQLTIVHALNAAEGRMLLSTSEGIEIARTWRTEADAVATRLRRMVPRRARIQVDVRVEDGSPAHAILHVAREVGAELIVMGVPPRARLDEAAFGSTLRSVLRRAQVPVLVLSVSAGGHPWLERIES